MDLPAADNRAENRASLNSVHQLIGEGYSLSSPADYSAVTAVST